MKEQTRVNILTESETQVLHHARWEEHITAVLASHFIDIDRQVERRPPADDAHPFNEQLSAVQAKLDRLVARQQEQSARRNNSR